MCAGAEKYTAAGDDNNSMSLRRSKRFGGGVGYLVSLWDVVVLDCCLSCRLAGRRNLGLGGLGLSHKDVEMGMEASGQQRTHTQLDGGAPLFLGLTLNEQINPCGERIAAYTYVCVWWYCRVQVGKERAKGGKHRVAVDPDKQEPEPLAGSKIPAQVDMWCTQGRQTDNLFG